MNADTVLSIRNLQVEFPIRSGLLNRRTASVKAVNNISLDVKRGETVGIVGESGCGKSTFGKAILRLIEPIEGTITYNDADRQETDVAQAKGTDLKKLRKELQIVFQDPYSSLNPAITVFESLRRGLRTHGITVRKVQRELLGELFEEVNLRPEYLNRYPHEFSGGERQRIAIVRALSVSPTVIVCDEVTSALDVSIQAQVLRHLASLKQEHNLTYLFISHNLAVVEYVADRIAVMYLGKIVELADATSLYKSPLHPYTQALFSAIPTIDPATRRERIVVHGEVPSARSIPSGCPYHTRCPIAIPRCTTEVPAFRTITKDGVKRQVACHRVSDSGETV